MVGMVFANKGKGVNAGHIDATLQNDAGKRSLLLSPIIADPLSVVHTLTDPRIDATAVQPTSGNTWALRTEQAESVAVVPAVFVDYLRVTLPGEPGMVAELATWCGELAERGQGWHGWYDRSAHVLDGGLLAWCSSAAAAERQGVVVDLPGAACAALGNKLLPFMAWCCDRGKVRRLDVAIDDHAGLLTAERLGAARDAQSIVSWSRRIQTVKDTDAETGECTGWTLYVGSRSRQSKALVRIYDKRLERLAHGKAVADEPWFRCEMEAHKNYADALARSMLADGPGAAVAQIKRRIRFTEPSATDTNRRRWPLADWWQAFIGDIDTGGQIVSGEAQDTTVDKMLEQVRKQSGPALAALMAAFGDDTSWLSDLVCDGERRMKPKHVAALVAFAQAQAEPAKVAHNGR